MLFPVIVSRPAGDGNYPSESPSEMRKSLKKTGKSSAGKETNPKELKIEIHQNDEHIRNWEWEVWLVIEGNYDKIGWEESILVAKGWETSEANAQKAADENHKRIEND